MINFQVKQFKSQEEARLVVAFIKWQGVPVRALIEGDSEDILQDTKGTPGVISEVVIKKDGRVITQKLFGLFAVVDWFREQGLTRAS